MAILNEAIHQRVANTRAAMRQRNLDALVVYAAPPALWAASRTTGNVRYLTNWWSGNISQSLLVLPVEGDAVLFTNIYSNPAGHQEIWVQDIRRIGESPRFGGRAAEVLVAGRDERIGIVGRAEMSNVLHHDLTTGLTRQQVIDADDLLGRLRMIKDAEEIELHRATAKIADAMLYAGFNGARANKVTADRLMFDMEYTGRRLGASFAKCWLDTGPAAGELSFEEWIVGNLPPIENGDQVHTGMYVVREGYWAHELRMGFRGKITPEMRQHAELALEVQEVGLAALKPGKPLRGVLVEMEKRIDELCPFSKQDDVRFAQGHGLGMEYNDPMVADVLRGWSESDEILVQPGMVMELHPNFHTAKLGMSVIGDMVLVTETGNEILTGLPRELYEI